MLHSENTVLFLEGMIDESDVEWARAKTGDGVAHAFPDGGRRSYCGKRNRVSEKNWTPLPGERGTVCFGCASRIKHTRVFFDGIAH